MVMSRMMWTVKFRVYPEGRLLGRVGVACAWQGRVKKKRRVKVSSAKQREVLMRDVMMWPEKVSCAQYLTGELNESIPVWR